MSHFKLHFRTPIFQMARIAPGDFIYYLRQNNRNINERIFFSNSSQGPFDYFRLASAGNSKILKLYQMGFLWHCMRRLENGSLGTNLQDSWRHVTSLHQGLLSSVRHFESEKRGPWGRGCEKAYASFAIFKGIEHNQLITRNNRKTRVSVFSVEGVLMSWEQMHLSQSCFWYRRR